MEVSRKYFQSFCEMRDSCIRRRGESDMENSRFAVIVTAPVIYLMS